MYQKPKLPSWPDLARSMAQGHLDAERYLAAAIESGDKSDVAAWRKLLRDSQKTLDKYQITIMR